MILNRKEIEKMYNWRQICFQYPQFCVHCGGFVEPGQNGSWNVSTKEVHHEKCPNYRDIPQIIVESPEDDVINQPWDAYSRLHFSKKTKNRIS